MATCALTAKKSSLGNWPMRKRRRSFRRTLRVSDGGPVTLASPETLTRRSLDPVVGRTVELRETMNILEHPIYKDIYDLCQEIEKLPASEQETKCVVMAGNLEKPAAQLVNTLREIKRIVLNMMPETTQRDLAHIIRLCLDAGITQKLDELNASAPNESSSATTPSKP